MNTGKYGLEITPYLDIFHVVQVSRNSCKDTGANNKPRLLGIHIFVSFCELFTPVNNFENSKKIFLKFKFHKLYFRSH